MDFFVNGDPDFPDLNRLFTDCVWDADTHSGGSGSSERRRRRLYDDRTGASREAIKLVEGLHRLEAAKALGEQTIVVFLVDARKH